ncbi:methylenetetrahydrofolate reductase [Terasakiella sp. A23]|uniref:methylenetetrahydrofolate reductase n=1 Tax=Terasakiella sp. FCG-A23 TaxID=3080561 RepID=UPI0029538DE6|nr:methylenetetrahydrofolate reductase [Terasakiella sp. A23]MDV7338932.1 methylenetetrahydrofolate reductase [Terasakiella sp. A23]
MTLQEEKQAVLSGLPVAAPLPKDVSVSFEFFPPKTEKMEETLWSSLKRLEPLNPSFVSVTYGAGGTTRERTHNTVVDIQKETTMSAAAHLTCVGSSKAEIDEIADRYWEEGIRHIVALRGDPEEGYSEYKPHPEGYAYAVDLVEGLKKRHDFEISVAGYPETHPDAPSAQFDIDYLKKKVDAGANRVITQYFFEAETFLRYRDKAAAAGVTVPIVPGILPVTNFKQVLKFSDACNTNVPAWMADLFNGLDDEPETRKLVAATVASELCRVLHANGVNDFHFYTLNRADLTYAFCHILGVRPKGNQS